MKSGIKTLNLTYEKEFTVQLDSADPNGELKPTALFRELQNTSIDHLDSIGIGREYCKENGKLWMLKECSAEIKRIPKENETVKFISLPPEYNCLSGIKLIKILDDTGDVIISSMGKWVLFDLASESKRPCDLGITLPKDSGIFHESLPYTFERFKPLNPTEAPRQFQVLRENFDVNQHLNNVAYIKYAIESLGFDFLDKYILTNIYVNYIKELPKQKVAEAKGFCINVLTERTETTSRHIVQSPLGDHAKIAFKWKHR